MSFEITVVVLIVSIGTLIYIQKLKRKQLTYTEPIKQKETVALHVDIWFGSQTGTAEDFAAQLCELIENLSTTELKFKAESKDLEDFDSSEFMEDIEKLHVFVVATYGEGDPTDNAQQFYSWLKECEENLSQHKYSVFGLGNKEYENYNKCGKVCKKYMEKNKASLVIPYCEGDDSEDIEPDFIKYQNYVKKYFIKTYGLNRTMNTNETNENKPKSKHKLIFTHKPSVEEVDQKNIPLSTRHFFEYSKAILETRQELRQNKVLTDKEPGSTLHLTFSGQKYKTAENFGILPENSPELVNETLERLQLTSVADEHISNKEGIYPLPLGCSLRDVFTKYISLHLHPTRSFCKKISLLAGVKEHKERLMFLGSEEGSEEYQELILEREIDLVELFEKFPSINAETILSSAESLAYFIDILPKIQPRWYTIASSDLRSEHVAISVSVVSWEKKFLGNRRRRFEGLCTNYLKRLKEKDSVKILIRKSGFKLPQQVSPKTKVLLIGAGTGIAPLRAFLEFNEVVKLYDMHLFFGCRHPEEDYLYKEELIDFEEKDILQSKAVAFSRKEKAKIYVQTVLSQNENIIKEAASGYVFVCGGTGMGKEVHDVLVDVLGLETVTKMIESHRYVQELWS
eukprot:augustus_masked-scaffold_2-processed-gene-8.42-mRNA-1 protein AED:0.07 eAED:0.08 QI:0/-1/0/1/-1/1/1/0/626